jgi:glycosyltransferase involved in cell wall biosynthesis
MPKLTVGVFHPALNVCGGAEWVAVNVINCLKKAGFDTIVLTDKRIDQERIWTLFGQKVHADAQMIFPLEFFPITDQHNIYSDFIRTVCLREKCNILIDTCSSALLPGVDITYVHFPFLGRLVGFDRETNIIRKLLNTYYFPYRLYERKNASNLNRIILANSKYTMGYIRRITGAASTVLYPPIPRSFFTRERCFERENVVVSVDRICPDKQLTIIPQIAKLTDKKIRFLIIGLSESKSELNRILNLITSNGLSDRVKVMTDVPREKVQSILRSSKVFLHPAAGEHFGVSIAEGMASGCIPVVHNSGGPREFVPERFRFNEVTEAARKIEKAVLGWSSEDANECMRIAQRFSEESFSTNFLRILGYYKANLLKKDRAVGHDAEMEKNLR